MKSHLIKQKLAAVLCALMTVSCAVPAALAEQYDTSAAQSGAITFEPFSLHVRQAEGGLSATVDGASAYEVEVTVRNTATGASVRKALAMGNGTATFSLEPVRRSEKHTSEPSPTSMPAWSERTLRHAAPFARVTPSFGSSGNLARSTALSTLLPLSFSSFFAPAGM